MNRLRTARFVALAALLLLGALAIPAWAQTDPVTTRTATPPYSAVIPEDIYVRSGPGEDYAPIGQLFAGDILRPVSRSEDGRWVLIQYARRFGWIRRDLGSWIVSIDALPIVLETQLTVTPAPGTSEAVFVMPTAVPEGNWISLDGMSAFLRSGPGTEYPVIDLLPNGANVVPAGRNEDTTWILIRHGAGFAWIYRTLVYWVVDLDALPVLTPPDLTPSPTFTRTRRPSATATFTPSPTLTLTPTPSDTPTATATPTSSATQAPRPTATATPSPTQLTLVTNTPMTTPPATIAPTATVEATRAPSRTSAPTRTASPTSAPGSTSTPQPTTVAADTARPSRTPGAANTARPVATATDRPTRTPSPQPTPTATDTARPTRTPRPPTATERPTRTPTSVSASATPEATHELALSPVTATRTPRNTNTPRPAATASPASTSTPTPMPTVAHSRTPARAPTADRLAETATQLAVVVLTAEPTTAAATPTPEPSATPSATPTVTSTRTPSRTPTADAQLGTATQVVALALTSGPSATHTPAATRTPRPGATPEAVVPIDGAGPQADNASLTVAVAALAVIGLLGYGLLYWRGAAAADRYADGFVIDTCPVCGRGNLSVETRSGRVLGIPRPAHTVRCDSCRSLLREVRPGRWRYAVDPMEDADLAQRFNGQVIGVATLRRLDMDRRSRDRK